MNKIGIMNYSIDVTELDYDSAKFTSMPNTKREKKFILVLDYILMEICVVDSKYVQH